MRLFVKVWEARADDGTPLGWLEHSGDGWRASVDGVGFVTSLTTLTAATQALKAELAEREQGLAS